MSLSPCARAAIVAIADADVTPMRSSVIINDGNVACARRRGDEQRIAIASRKTRCANRNCVEPPASDVDRNTRWMRDRSQAASTRHRVGVARRAGPSGGFVCENAFPEAATGSGRRGCRQRVTAIAASVNAGSNGRRRERLLLGVATRCRALEYVEQRAHAIDARRRPAAMHSWQIAGAVRQVPKACRRTTRAGPSRRCTGAARTPRAWRDRRRRSPATSARLRRRRERQSFPL